MKRLQWPSWMPIDPYILLLLGTVGLAALLPARGTGADVASGASTAAIAFLFFLYGARLSTREAMEGLKHWRLHGTVLACTFVIFPLLGLAARGLEPVFLTHNLYTGLLFLTLVPSTIQSSIAFTSIARGNVPAAICAGSFSSLAGIVITPLLAAALLGNSGGGFSADSLVKIVLQLLVPFMAGQVLRPGSAGSSPATRRSSDTSTAARSCSSSTPRSARAWCRASGTRSALSGWPDSWSSRPCCWP